MKTKISTPKLTLYATRFIAAVLFALLFALPALLELYCKVRVLKMDERTAVLAAFYCCALVSFLALWRMDALLRNIISGRVFIRENVHYIRTIQWCCGCISLICLPAAVFYYPLVFLVVIMAFLCLCVSVLGQVMSAAVTIREENDLTI